MYELKEEIDIKDLIYEVRGKQVMLDSDLARLYGCKNGTKTVNQAVKRNIDRFPEDFCFRLTKEEAEECSRSQIGTLSERGNNIKYLPYAFTEQGVAMLSAVLRTPVASIQCVRIMRAFVAIRKFISNNIMENNYLKDMVFRHDDEIKQIENVISTLESKELVNQIFFNGEIYDAYSLLIDIIGNANKEIIIIDNYIDKSMLDILSKKKVNVTVLLVTDKNKVKLNNLDIEKFNKQYPLLKIKYTNIFHDRFIIIDKGKLYHLGASLKDLGKKVFAINVIEDDEILINIKNKINHLS